MGGPCRCGCPGKWSRVSSGAFRPTGWSWWSATTRRWSPTARRRPALEPVAGGVPPELAAGPSVPRWATAAHLPRVEATRGTPQAEAATMAAMLAARRLWRDACTVWLDGQGLEGAARRSAIPSRRPYWPH